ncbi:hypothetical protein C8246_07230 [Paracidovorax avenae]|nr:hypothetical protein C8246_07230 [Paracidovorax avenae]
MQGKVNFGELSFLQNCKYAYGLCLRLAPFYIQFSQNYSSGDIGIHSTCMEMLLKNIDDEEKLACISEMYTPLLEPIVPDMEDFNSELLASLGLDAITSTLTLLDYLKEKQVGLIAEIKNISLNSAEFISYSMDEFLAIRPNFSKLPMESENNFNEALLDLAKRGMRKGTYQQSLANLVLEYSY